ncbi:MAG TPA: DsbC family protein [Burkholderiales bacterium]|nr:DsbC family protein [Burkholderiales bacterium]
MTMFKKVICCVLALAAICSVARADESAVRQAVQTKFPKMALESVSKTPFAGIYEVVLDGQVLYTDEKTSYLFSGNLLDIRGQQPRNLTQESTQKLSAAALAKSTDSAVKRVKGNGKRVIYTFEDPNCGSCKELQKELKKVNDVTIYTFLWPILSPDSVEKSKAIWCAKDKAKAWEDVMLKGVAPAGKRDCDTPLEQNAQLAQRFGIRGTPGVYLANGQQIGGYLAADKIEAALAGR